MNQAGEGGETWGWADSLYYQPNSTNRKPGYFCRCPDLAVAVAACKMQRVRDNPARSGP